MSFVFNQTATSILDGTLDLSIPANYYLHLVTAIPGTNASTVADLVITNATGYQPKPLLGQTFDNNILNFNNATFSAMTSSTNIVGSVLCQRVGGSFVDTDPVICFSEINNATGIAIQVKPNLEKVIIDFGTNGAIKINDLYGYQSGSFTGVFPDTNGIFYLPGTSNNTAAFSNPADKINILRTDGSNINTITDRNDTTNASVVSGGFAFDFHTNLRKLKIKPTKIYIKGSHNFHFSVYGSNTLPNFISSYFIPNNGYWTPLAERFTINTLTALSASTYYRWLLVYNAHNATATIQEVEFYDSSISSNVLNMV